MGVDLLGEAEVERRAVGRRNGVADERWMWMSTSIGTDARWVECCRRDDGEEADRSLISRRTRPTLVAGGAGDPGLRAMKDGTGTVSGGGTQL